MLGGGARINLIFARSCRTRFARVRGEKRISNRKGDLSEKCKLWVPGLGIFRIDYNFSANSTAFTRPAGLDLVYRVVENRGGKRLDYLGNPPDMSKYLKKFFACGANLRSVNNKGAGKKAEGGVKRHGSPLIPEC